MALRATLPPALLVMLAAASSAHAAGDPVMPLSQVHPGLHCSARSVVRGTTISTFSADVIDVVDGDAIEGDRILVRVSGPAVDATGIAEGFSGSPVYCPDASGLPRVIGAISETVGEYGNKQVLVTPIAQILAEQVDPPRAKAPGGSALLRSARPLAEPIMIAGLPARLAAGVQAAGAKVGRVLIPVPAGPSTRFAPTPLVPGASVSVGFSSGAIAVGGIGTVSYRDGQNVWAFGHQFDSVGARSLLLQDAYVYSVIGNPVGGDNVSYKLAAPGHNVGTITNDAPNAVVGRVGALPSLTPLTIDALDGDTGETATTSVQVADETDVGLPDGTAPLSLVGPLAVAAAATNVFDGAPFLESGRMCMRIRLREYKAPFGFCNRYVLPGSIINGLSPPLANATAGDASSVFSLLDAVSFARLHVTSVHATMTATRGLALGYLVTARAPRHARPGQRITLRLRVRLYRGTIVTRKLRVRLPARLRPGSQRIRVLGSGPDDASGLEDLGSIIIDVLGGSGTTTGSPGPRTVRELVALVKSLARFDGVRVGYPGLGGHAGRATAPAFVDPGLRIAGRATARVQVLPSR